jgi:putative adenylate-forming enzyme
MEPRLFGVKLVYVDYTHPTAELVALINEKKLNILAGPPSLLSHLARHRESIVPRIDTLISYAEVLDDETRSFLEETFDSPVVQIYQGAEGFIGSTCKIGKLHLNEDVLLVEEDEHSDKTNHAKKVIITDLYRTVQPMIRYAMDDILEFDPEGCECGSCFRVIKRIHGRVDEIFLLKGVNGDIRYLFPDYVVRSINQASDDILEFQAIQHSMEMIEIRLILKNENKRALIEKTICENLEWRTKKVGAQLGDIHFNDKLPERNQKSQKLIRVIRRF